MGFLPNYDNPGPERDLPRKTGIFRLWEMLSRDFWDLFRAGFLALLGCVPFLLGVLYSLSAHVLIYAPAALAITAGYLGLSARFYLFALPLLPVINLWLPALPALFLIYPGINENLHIEDRLRGN